MECFSVTYRTKHGTFVSSKWAADAATALQLVKKAHSGSSLGSAVGAIGYDTPIALDPQPFTEASRAALPGAIAA